MQISPCDDCKWRAVSPMRGCRIHRRLRREKYTTNSELTRLLLDTFIEPVRWEPGELLELECMNYEKGEIPGGCSSSYPF